MKILTKLIKFFVGRFSPWNHLDIKFLTLKNTKMHDHTGFSFVATSQTNSKTELSITPPHFFFFPGKKTARKFKTHQDVRPENHYSSPAVKTDDISIQMNRSFVTIRWLWYTPRGTTSLLLTFTQPVYSRQSVRARVLRVITKKKQTFKYVSHMYKPHADHPMWSA